MADLGAQVQLNAEINKLIEDRNVLFEEQLNLMSMQLNLQIQLLNIMQDTIESTNQHVTSVQSLSSSLSSAALNAATLSSSLTNVSTSTDSTAEAYEILGKRLAKANKEVIKITSSVKALNKVMLTAKGVVKGTFNVMKSMISSLFDIGRSILAFPFDVQKALIKTANQVIDISPISQALEEVRKQFGDLGTSTGAIIKDTFRPMRAEFNKLTASGHSFAKTFGAGREGMAAAIKFNAELMGALKGGTYELRKEIGENIAEHAIYRKGLGLTAEQQAILIKRAQQQGKSSTELQQEMAKFALTMGKRFGFSAKELGSAMGEMAADVKNFSTLTNRQYAQIAVYTKKLGIETKQLLGLIDKYDNFEEAAKSASMLNQTFGMQIDVLKMMREEDPAARLRMLQDSFAATGRSYDRLSRVERKRLADLAGLDAAAAEAAFSQHGLSMSYEEITAAGEDTEDSTKSLDSTMKDLSKNMERVLQLGKTFESFIDAFFQGFTFGFFRLTPVTKLLENVRKSLFETWQEGKSFAQTFYDAFPGVQKLVEGLTEFYDPEKWGEKMEKITGVFSKFFDAIKDPKKIREAFTVLWNDIFSLFTDMFDPNNSTNTKIAEGLDEFGTTLGNIALVFATKVAEIVTDTFNLFAEILSGKKTFSEAIGEIFKIDPDIAAGLEERFGENFEGLSEAIDKLWPALSDAFIALFEKLGKLLINAFINMGPTLKDAFVSLGPCLEEALIKLAPHIAQGMLAAWNAFKKLDWEMQAGLIAYQFGDSLLPILTGTVSALVTGFNLIGIKKTLAELAKKNVSEGLQDGIKRGAAEGAERGAAKSPGILRKIAEKIPKKGGWALGAAAVGGLAWLLSGGEDEGIEPPAENQGLSTPTPAMMAAAQTYATPSYQPQVVPDQSLTVPAPEMMPLASAETPSSTPWIQRSETVSNTLEATAWTTTGIQAAKAVAQSNAGQKALATSTGKLAAKLASKTGLASLGAIPGLGILTSTALTAWELYDVLSKKEPATKGDWARVGFSALGIGAGFIPGAGAISTGGYLATVAAESGLGGEGAANWINEPMSGDAKSQQAVQAQQTQQAIPLNQEKASQEVIAAAEQNANLTQKANLLIAQAEEFANLNKRIEEAKSKIPDDVQIGLMKKGLQGYVEQMNKASLEIYQELEKLWIPEGTINKLATVNALSTSINELSESFGNLNAVSKLDPENFKKQLDGLRQSIGVFHNMFVGNAGKQVEGGGRPILYWLDKIVSDIEFEGVSAGKVRTSAVTGLLTDFDKSLAQVAGFKDQSDSMKKGFYNFIRGLETFHSEIVEENGIMHWFKYLNTILKPAELQSSISKINEYITVFYAMQQDFANLSIKHFTIPELKDSLVDLHRAVRMVDILQASFVDTFQKDGMGNVENIVDNINRINTLIKQTLAEDVQTIVDINDSLSGNKSMTIKHENLSLNLTVHVAMDAKELVAGIMEVKRLPNKQNITWAPNIVNNELG